MLNRFYCFFFQKEENFAFVTVEMISYISFLSMFDSCRLFLFFLVNECTQNLLHLNVAACLLKLGEHKKSIETCNKVTLKLCASRNICRPPFFHIQLDSFWWSCVGVRCESGSCESSLSTWDGLHGFWRL